MNPRQTIGYYIEKWLKDYHNTTPEEVERLHPVEAHDGTWYMLYRVTPEQYDEWYKWAYKELRKEYKAAQIHRALFWLDISPSVTEY